MNKALLLVAHGSRRPHSNDEIRSLARQLNARDDTSFDVVDCAFLELARPSIPDGIAKLAASGARHIIVLPYFLAAGRHVHEDIPAEVATGRQVVPQVTVEIAPYLGQSTSMLELLLSLAESTHRAVAS